VRSEALVRLSEVVVICCFKLSLELQSLSNLAETSEMILYKLTCSACSYFSEGKLALLAD